MLGKAQGAAYLVLSLFCLLTCWQQFTTYLTFPRGTTVERLALASTDLPWLAVCPQPSLRVSNQLLRKHTNSSNIRKLVDGDPFDYFFEVFGNVVAKENMSSNQVLQFYNDLTLNSNEIIPSAHVILENGTRIEMLRDNSALPNGETIDCPVLVPPKGISEPASIR